MEEKYIVFRGSTKLFSLSKDILQQLENKKLITIYNYSVEDLVNNNVDSYNIKEYNKFEKRTQPRSTWCRYRQKVKQYISFKDFSFLCNNYFYIYDNQLYQIKNILNDQQYIKQLLRIFFQTKCKNTLDATFKYIQKNNIIKYENNVYICECKEFINVYKAIAHNYLWFIDNNENINYANKENLLNIQRFLIDGGNVRDIAPDSHLCIQWWIARGWDESYAKQKISEIQTNHAIQFANKRKQNPEKYKDIQTNQIGYWIKQGYSKQEAKEKVKERQQTFTLEKCIQKYGEIEGKQKFEERQKKWQNTLQSKDDYIEVVIKRCSHSFYSNISQELFDTLYKLLQDNNINCGVYYHNLNHEWGFGIKKHGGVLYDFVIPELKYAIEFNGNRFHPNKEKLSKKEFKNWTNPWGVTAKEQYKHDMLKNNAIIKKGFILDIVWEDEYLENKDKILNIILNRIKQIYNGTKIS